MILLPRLHRGPTLPLVRLDMVDLAEQVHTSGVMANGKGARTRRKLLDAAEACFGALGYHDASIVKITEAAGVAQGTFYLYFASKQQLFDEVVSDLNRRVRHAMSEAASGAPTRLEAERLGFAGFFKFTVEHPALYRVIRQAEFVSPDLCATTMNASWRATSAA